jgi:hypothetical protein
MGKHRAMRDMELKTVAMKTRSGSRILGWGGILFGLPFMVAGVFISLLAFGVFGDDMERNASNPSIAAFGLLFFLPGLWISANGVYTIFKKKSAARRRALFADRPWVGDFDWDPECIRDQGRRDLFTPFIFTAVWFAFLTPFLMFFIGAGIAGKDLMVSILLLVFVAVGFLMLGMGVYRLLRYLKYGASRLWFDRFPFFLGDRLDARFNNDEGIGVFRRLTFTLRCIEERLDVVHRGNETTYSVAACQHYADTQELDNPLGDRALQARQDFRVSFPLPAGMPPSRLAELHPTYWLLEVKADTPGIDFDTSFLVPVYRDPKAVNVVRAKCACGVVLKLRPDLAGKRIRCPRCRKVMTVPLDLPLRPGAGEGSEDSGLPSPPSEKMSLGLKIFLGIFGLVGAAIIVCGFVTLFSGLVSLGWSETQGVALSADIKTHSDSDSTSYEPQVEYSYQVKGVDYRSSRRVIGDYSSGFGHAKKIIDRYPAGSSVKVYYNPRDPASAVLETGIGGGAWGLLTIGSLFLAFPVAILIFYYKRSEHWRKMNPRPAQSAIQ